MWQYIRKTAFIEDRVSGVGCGRASWRGLAGRLLFKEDDDGDGGGNGSRLSASLGWGEREEERETFIDAVRGRRRKSWNSVCSICADAHAQAINQSILLERPVLPLPRVKPCLPVPILRTKKCWTLRGLNP